MLFTAEHEEPRRTLQKFIAAEINPHVDDWEAAGEFPAHEVFKKLGGLGFLGLNKPVEFGGAGLDYSYALMMAEELGAVRSGSVPAAIGVQTDMATPALARYGSDALRREFLQPAISGEAVACVGVSEPGAGSDVAEIRTNARSDGDDYVIDGGKMWITNGAQADWMCLLANTGDGPKHRNKSLICVPMKAKGVTVARKLDKLGMRASDTAQIFFEGVRVPKRNRIGEEGKGFVYQMTQFQEERLWIAAACLKAHERTIAETIAYARQRKAFGRSILDNQTVHFKLAELQTEIELLRSLIYRAAEAMVAGADMTQLATMAKLKAGRLGRELPSACLQYWGGMGFMNETPVSRAFRDHRIDFDRGRRRGGDADDPVQGNGNAARDGTIAGQTTTKNRNVLRLDIEHRVQLQSVGQHDDGLGVALALVHGVADRFFLVGEKPAAQAVRISNDPAPAMILPDEQARTGRGRGADTVVNHGILLELSSMLDDPAQEVGAIVAAPNGLFGPAGRSPLAGHSNQKLRRQHEAERDRQQRDETGEHSESRRPVAVA